MLNNLELILIKSDQNIANCNGVPTFLHFAKAVGTEQYGCNFIIKSYMLVLLDSDSDLSGVYDL